MTNISDIQLQANRNNAQHSTGPRTEAGKSRSRLNATRHGLTGQFFVLTDDDRRAYQTFEAGMLASLKPEGAEETQLAISIAQDHWRLNRSRAIEFNSIGIGHHEHADDHPANSPEVQAAIAMAQTFRRETPYFAILALYEHRINRTIARNKKDLTELQRVRRDAEAAARHEAELLLRMQHKSGQIPPEGFRNESIEVNGFVYSVILLTQDINRKVTLKQAAFYEKHGWNTALPNPHDGEMLPLAA